MLPDQSASIMADSKRKRSVIHYFPIFGCISTGLIYATVGVIALLSFFKVREGGADEGSMLALINDYIVGKIFVWIILSGIVCYIIWRFYEAFTDPYDYGAGPGGIIKRVCIGLSTIADIMIVYTATRILLGIGEVMVTGEPQEERQMAGAILEESWGNEVLISTGIFIVVAALTQLFYGVTRGYRERINMEDFRPSIRIMTHIVAWSGYIARGIILGIIGYFLAKSGMIGNAEVVVNTDKAFDFIGDHVGHFYFIVVALGTICYGVFMFMLAAAYDTDKD